jgi:NAD(P)H dehydrogenase (quinone)
MSVKVSVAYHSGYGHTKKVAEAVFEGIKDFGGAHANIIAVDAISDADWETLDASDAIIFGCPTYMGSASAKFKDFIDKTSVKWMKQTWKNKIAAGFTNSASYSGDKLSTIIQLNVLAMQQGMIWVGQAIMPPSLSGVEGPDSKHHNRLGSSMGLMTQANAQSGPDIAPPIGDLETAKLFGKRVAEIAAQFVKGRA